MFQNNFPLKTALAPAFRTGQFPKGGQKRPMWRQVKILAASLALGLVFTLGIAAYTYVYSHGAQRAIADNVIRFHVRANSNSAADQALKDYVRDRVLAAFEANANNIEESRTGLEKNLAKIQRYAEDIVRDAGYNHPVSASISHLFFPTQFYGGMVFPPGEYEALQIIIGDGRGGNWWCLMFPPLCYVDMTATESGRIQLSQTVPTEGFRLLTHQETPERSLTVRFRVVEWWQNRRGPAQGLPPGDYVVGG